MQTDEKVFTDSESQADAIDTSDSSTETDVIHENKSATVDINIPKVTIDGVR